MSWKENSLFYTCLSLAAAVTAYRIVNSSFSCVDNASNRVVTPAYLSRIKVESERATAALLLDLCEHFPTLTAIHEPGVIKPDPGVTYQDRTAGQKATFPDFLVTSCSQHQQGNLLPLRACLLEAKMATPKNPLNDQITTAMCGLPPGYDYRVVDDALRKQVIVSFENTPEAALYKLLGEFANTIINST